MSLEPQYGQSNENEWQSNNGISLRNGATELEVSIVKMEMPSSFELLYLDDIWICDTGASSHLSKSNVGAMNVTANGSQTWDTLETQWRRPIPWTCQDDLLAKMEAQE